MSTSNRNHPHPVLPTEPTALVTERDVAALSSLSPAFLQKLRRNGTGPAFVRVGAAVRYPAGAVRAWLDTLSSQR